MDDDVKCTLFVFRVSSESILLKFCKQNDTLRELQEAVPAVRKCCPKGQVYDLSKYEIEGSIRCLHESQEYLEPNLYSSIGQESAATTSNFSAEGIPFLSNPKGWCRGSSNYRLLLSQQPIGEDEAFLLVKASNILEITAHLKSSKALI
jgi:hypothetical protein